MKMHELEEAVVNSDLKTAQELSDPEHVKGLYFLSGSPGERWFLFKKVVDTDNPSTPAFKLSDEVRGVPWQTGTWADAISAAKKLINHKEFIEKRTTIIDQIAKKFGFRPMKPNSYYDEGNFYKKGPNLQALIVHRDDGYFQLRTGRAGRGWDKGYVTKSPSEFEKMINKLDF